MKKRVLNFIDIERDLLNSEDGIIAIFAGTSSGKTTLIEGLHDNENDIKGLVDYCKVKVCTSRKAKVDETIKKRKKSFSKADCCNVIKDNADIHTNSYYYELMIENYIKDDETTYFWRNYDFIVVDEVHSLATDSMFASCSYTMKCMIEAILEDRKNNNINTKILLLSATPEPVEWLIRKWGAKIYDLRADTQYIKPNSIDIMNYIPASNAIVEKLKQNQTVVYYMARFDNLFKLIKKCKENYIPDESIAVFISDEKILKRLEQEYEGIYKNTDIFKNVLSDKEVIDDRFKLIITNSKSKEAININSNVDLVVVESQCIVDIIQTFGRFRNGINKAYFIKNARQFINFDKICEEQAYYDEDQLKHDTKHLVYLRKLSSDYRDDCAQTDNISASKYIKDMENRSIYERYNPFLDVFEFNEVVSDFNEYCKTNIHKLKNAIDKKTPLSEVYDYFKNISIEYIESSKNEGSIYDIFEDNGWILGESCLSYMEFKKLTAILNEIYVKLPDVKKEYKRDKYILKAFGLDYEPTGCKHSKETRKYRVYKIHSNINNTKSVA